MSRKIAFRAWNPDNPNTSQRMVNNPLHRCDPDGVLENKRMYANWVLMQFTGLLDKNGVEIYEGDIIKNGDYEAGKVYWSEHRAQWMVEWFEKEERVRVPDELCDYWQHLTPEIIGNLYEHPHLLEENNQ